MTQTHPIMPPPELVEEWWNVALPNRDICVKTQLCTQAAQWGADQELEACVEWLDDTDCEDPQEVAQRLRAARRILPPSLKEQALAVIENSAICDHLSPQDETILRLALEALDD